MSEAKKVTKAVVTSTVATGVFLAVPHIADAALGDQTLKKGMSHPDVKELQEALRADGHFTYEQSTGYFGTITEEAVRSFQRKHRLVVDGIAGPQTLAQLKKAKASTPAPVVAQQPNTTNAPATLTTNSVLQIGTSSELVAELQRRLKERGYFHQEPTGYYGRVTMNAVRTFQRDERLLVDGIAGPQTLSVLIRHHADVPNEEQEDVAVLKVGMSGDDVRKLQEQLKRLGYFKATATGYYGEITEASVRNFQTKQQIRVTGSVDTFTGNLIEQLVAELDASGVPEFHVLHVVADASNLIGSPYLWGGDTPTGFDCSGFLYYIFKNNGKTLPRSVAEIWNAGMSVEERRVGDIVFFETYTDGPSHAGLYIGNDQFVHSGASTGVTISSLQTSYWSERYLGAKRYH